jgi:hypothetical protein
MSSLARLARTIPRSLACRVRRFRMSREAALDRHGHGDRVIDSSRGAVELEGKSAAVALQVVGV